MKKLTFLIFSLVLIFAINFQSFSANQGDILITEWMANPAAVADAVGEYVELFNTTGTGIDIDGWILKDDDSDTHTINNGGPLVVPAGGFLVLGIGIDVTYVVPDYVYTGIALSNSADEIVLVEAAIEICRVVYTNGDPFGAGVSCELNSTVNHVNGVTQFSDYIASTTPLSSDFGSPGTAGNTIIGGGNTPPVITGIVQTPASGVLSSDVVSVSADVTDSDGTITLVELNWGTISGSLTNTINMSFNVGDTYTTDSDIPAQTAGTVVYYEVAATDDAPETTTSAEISYTVFPTIANLPYLQGFDPNLNDMYAYNALGDQVWGITTFGNPPPCAIMSGYSGGAQDNEDWMITPSFDFTGITNNIILSFEEAINYESSVVDNEKVLISTDYSGTGDPSLAAWTELTMPSRSTGTSWTFVSTGDLDISSYIGNSNVHIAFKYLSTIAGAGTWEVDNVSLSEISPILVADFVADQTSIYEGSTVNFSDLTSGGTTPYTYSWDLDGDGFEDATGSNPSFTYSTAGLYTVELTVTDAALDTDIETKVDYITVSVNPFANLVINEVDADQVGTDDQEFIELYDGGAGNTDLTGLVVVLYNGSDNASYNPATDLDGYFTNAQGYLVLGSALVPNVDIVIGTTNIIQNGADAVAIHVGDAADFPNDTPVTNTNLIDAIVYGTNDPDAVTLLSVLTPGQPQVNESGRGSSYFHSNQRSPNGSGGQLITTTYDQFSPTPGAENTMIFTEWTGVIDEDWENAGNWTNGLPTGVANHVAIIDIAGKAAPVIYGSIIISQLHLIAGQLNIAPGGDLTTTGLFTNSGVFYMSNAAGISASYIDQGGLAGFGSFAFDRDLFCSGSNPNNPADPFGWHYLGAPIDGLSTDNLPDYFINQWDETTGNWMNYAGTTPCIQYAPAETLDGIEAWSLNYDSQWPTYGCPQTPAGNMIQFNGSFTNLHTGIYSAPATIAGTGPNAGWNMYGNPYPSSIDPSLFNWTGFDNTTLHGVAIYDGCAGNYIYSNSANFYPYNVGPTQGFFLLALTPGTFALAGTERIHDNTQVIFKEAVTDLVTIEATGDGTSDLAYIRFMEGSQAGMDVADFPKMFSSTEGLAQIYTTSGADMLAVNALPATSVVPMGFTSVTSGEYTISAIETSDFTNVVLEDRVTGQQTDLLTNSYTFNYTVNDNADRFFVHFTPLGTAELSASSINIWSEDHMIYVQTPEVMGDIVVYNMMGQEITRTNIEAGLNIVPVTNVNAFYVVKIVGSKVSKTGKVYVK